MSVGSRLAVLRSVDVNHQVMTWDPLIGSVGEAVGVAATFRGRLEGDGNYSLPSAGGMILEKTITFQEVI